MLFDNIENEALWRCYQRGYVAMVRSGLYFRQLIRPAFSHVYFQRAVPLLQVYAQSNKKDADYPPGFTEQMVACPVTLRDLAHLDYAICLGFSEDTRSQIGQELQNSVLGWPGPADNSGIFIAADAILIAAGNPFIDELEYDEDDDEDEGDDDDEDDGSSPPFDL